MFARIYGATILGLHGNIITVETDISNGLPAFEIVGLATTSVKESKERVRSAIKNSGYEFPMRRITVNLAPADLKKDSAGLDIAIAIGMMVSSGQIPAEACQQTLFIGELALDGAVRPVTGILPMILQGAEQGFHTCFVSAENANEALLCRDVTIYSVSSFSDIVEHLLGTTRLSPSIAVDSPASAPAYAVDFLKYKANSQLNVL